MLSTLKLTAKKTKHGYSFEVAKGGDPNNPSSLGEGEMQQMNWL